MGLETAGAGAHLPAESPALHGTSTSKKLLRLSAIT